jgi:hypothetical protein
VDKLDQQGLQTAPPGWPSPSADSPPSRARSTRPAANSPIPPSCLYLCVNAAWPNGDLWLCLLLFRQTKRTGCIPKYCPKIGWARLYGCHGSYWEVAIGPCPCVMA